MSNIYDNNFYDGKNLLLSQPLRHTRIGYDNLISTVTATSSQAGFNASLMANPFTYQFWKPSTFPASIVADMGRGQTVDYVAFGAHKFSGCQLVVEYSVDNNAYVEITTAIIEDNSAIMLLFEPVQARYIRVTLTGWATEATLVSDFENQVYEEATYSASATGDAQCAVMYVGLALAMDAPCEYNGHNPATLNYSTKVNNNRSDGGQWLGRSVTRRALTTAYDFNKIDPSWFRANVQPFVEQARYTPFFVAWRPEDYAKEVIYGQTDGDIKPTNDGINNFMAISFSITGHSN